mmetsp:Transcript_9322/g.16794  ORF Transcript_9322/g.16794 Transcript_9322/m.16794 type:complete len:229 (+) Transcript_9322:190-876(+)
MRPFESNVTPTFSKPSPEVYGFLPIATNTISASIVSFSPFDDSTASSTLSPTTCALVTFVFNLNFIFCFFKIFKNSFPISASKLGQIRSKYSTTVTSAPSLLQTDPISNPITPPPITIIFSGTCFNSNAPVLDTMRSSSIGTLGNDITSDPVAIMIFFALMFPSCDSFPSKSLTATSFALTNDPNPLIYFTLFFLNNPSMPFVNPETEFIFCFIILGKSIVTFGAIIP